MAESIRFYDFRRTKLGFTCMVSSSLHKTDDLLRCSLNPCAAPRKKEQVPFGQNMTLDFLTFYVLKYRGEEVVGRLMLNVPEEVKEMARRLDLTFYERYTSIHLHTIPEDIRTVYLERLAEAGVLPWDEHDWEEFREIRAFLGRHHPIVLAQK